AILSQTADHLPFGGVVPEIAARAHIIHLDSLIARAMDEAGLDFSDLDAIAATAGPGLLGGVIVGLTTAKALALASGKPLIAINHLEGHALTPGLTEGLKPPYLLLLVSGGHTQLVSVEGVGEYIRYGTTIDDALGEAFDKTAKMLGLGYPGGPHVERLATSGEPTRFAFPRPLLGKPGCHFSFSGLKTAVRLQVEASAPMDEQTRADIAASFQAAVAASLNDRLKHAMTRFREAHAAIESPSLVIAGGVAANVTIRESLRLRCTQMGWRLSLPPLALCTDNAAMIAWAGAERLALGLTSPLDAPARARWPLDPQAETAPGAGVKA
ncbi:MAG: tRNA (adenosine(37)-N6)-threonylcarbamoyltransferase complex transferase subunit TsaD, partial [Aestuariivirgaceae bacterium]|nr:tRNA (adenosine(37)-N6)-threonylcarbamoyltransferase complex transferase subunit TsaD [Aestuariivirgaceae bacterium]